MFIAGFGFFAAVLLLWDNISTCRDDISTCPAASRRHFDVSCCSKTTFRFVLLLQDDISTPERHFDLSCCSRTRFRRVLLLQADISTCPAARERHFDLSCCSRTTFRRIQLLRDDVSTLAPGRQLSN